MALHVGVLGTGGWCPVHLAALAASPHVGQVSLAGRNETAAAQLASQYPVVRRTVADPRELLDDPTVDLVHIVLPHHLHAPLASAALQAGKHVICEKPAATSLVDFDRMCAAAKAAGRRLLVVMNQLYNPVAWRVRQLVDEGALGRPFLSVENSYAAAAANYRRLDYWRNTVEQGGGGVLIDGGYHMVYRHLYTLAGQGSPQWVLADTPQLAVGAAPGAVPGKGEDFVSTVVGYSSGLRIQWAHGWTLAAPPSRRRQSFLAGSEATLELTDEPDRPLQLHTASGTQAIDVPQGPTTGPDTTHACLLDYLDCVAQNRCPQRASLALARMSLATILAAYASGRSGRRETIGP